MINEYGLLGLMALAFVLGIKHGMDADHLATIDGFVRRNTVRHPKLARYSGLLFSMGHGTVVVTVACLASHFTSQRFLPGWLETFGTCVSIAFLILLGILNTQAALSSTYHPFTPPVGIKTKLFSTQACGPWAVVAVGSLFAFSFDTLSQALLFSAASHQMGSTWLASLLGLLFTLGMIVTDAINGLWTAYLLRRADQMAINASRIMSLSVAGLSFAIAILGMIKLFWSQISTPVDSYGVQIGICVLLFIFISYRLAMKQSPAQLI